MSDEDLQKRLRELEMKVALMEQKNQERDRKIDTWYNALGKILWGIFGAVGAYIFSWVIGGGLAK